MNFFYIKGFQSAYILSPGEFVKTGISGPGAKISDLVTLKEA